MQKKSRIGAVSYLNTKPLIYGFEQGLLQNEIELTTNYPSKLASLMQKNELDIALLPVAAIPTIPNAVAFSNFCIGAQKKVASVCLFSHVPIEDIQEIYLDYQSKTSVALLRILLKHYWQTRPILIEAEENYIATIKDKKAGVIIGDRALENLTKFPFVYDLAEAWQDYAQLPFVFATWVTNQELSEEFVKSFNEANQLGFKNLDTIIQSNPFPSYDLRKYYSENIYYSFDENMQKGMTLFLKLMNQL